MSVKKSNSISIYLVKKNFKRVGDIFKNAKDVEKYPLNDSSVFYYCPDQKDIEPQWLSFFDSKIPKLYSKNIKAVLVTTIVYKNSEWRFAITFGYGRYLINNDAIVRGFGNKIVLQLVDTENVKCLEVKSFSGAPKIIKQQILSLGKMNDFIINRYFDALSSVKGKIDRRKRRKDCGKFITGKDC